VLTNLLSNAIKFSPDESIISVTTKQIGDQALFEVKDQGRGLPEGQKDRVFERYHQVDGTADAEKKGSGLGLTICKALVEAHGGTIGATNNENSGSTFWFRIPIQNQKIHGGTADNSIKLN